MNEIEVVKPDKESLELIKLIIEQNNAIIKLLTNPIMRILPKEEEPK